MLKNRSFYSVVISLFVSSCAQTPSTSSTPTIMDLTKKFSDAITASSTALQTEAAAKQRVRRVEAIQELIVSPDDALNLPRTDPALAFKNYVCAGAASLEKEKAFLSFAQSYAQASTKIVTPAADTFSDQLSQYNFLMGSMSAPSGTTAAKPESVASVGTPDLTSLKDPYLLCLADVDATISSQKPVPATDRQDEVVLAAIPAAIAAYQALFNALQTAAKDALKITNQVEAKTVLKTYVVAMHPRFLATQQSDLGSDKLADAWKRRKAQSLWAPHITFLRLLAIVNSCTTPSPSVAKQPAAPVASCVATDPDKVYQIKALSIDLNNELAEYDALRLSPSPDKLLSSLVAAEATLYKAATDDSFTANDAYNTLVALIADVTLAGSDYKAASTAVTGAETATNNLGH